MAKKELKGSKKAVEAEDRAADDEAEDGGSGHEVSTRASAAQQRRARMRERIAAASDHDAHDDHAHDHDHAHGHDHHDDDESVDTSNDPSWWVPHTVMGALVVIGILGFFGAFNSVAAKLGYGGMPSLAQTAHEAHTTKPAEPPAPPAPRPVPQPAQQPPREMFGAKHLLVMYKGSMRAPETVTRTKEEAKTRAEEARKKAKAGTKFEDLVKEYSDEPGAGARGGDLGKFPKGRMVGPFQDGLEKTKVGEVSDLVETPFGYHVILRTQ